MAEKLTLASMCAGGVQERIDRALAKISDNILDLNTDAKKKRVLDVKITLTPNEDDREDVSVEVQTSVKLAPEMGLKTQLFINKDFRSGVTTLTEHSKGAIKGQLVDFIKKSTEDFKDGQYIVQVVSPTKVILFSSLDADRQRETLAVVKAEIPEFSFGQFIGNEEFVIGVQSKFLNDDAEANDKPIILQFAGNVKAGTVAEYGDTGVGQKAAIKKGVASLQEVEVPSPCRLMPYRTFTEVAQPMSNFIFRVKDNDRYGVTCALFEADGGAWKNEAKANIKAYLEKELADVSNIFVIS